MKPTSRFMKYGGQFVPESLRYALGELEDAYRAIVPSNGFSEEMKYP